MRLVACSDSFRRVHLRFQWIRLRPCDRLAHKHAFGSQPALTVPRWWSPTCLRVTARLSTCPQWMGQVLVPDPVLVPVQELALVVVLVLSMASRAGVIAAASITNTATVAWAAVGPTQQLGQAVLLRVSQGCVFRTSGAALLTLCGRPLPGGLHLRRWWPQLLTHGSNARC